MSTTATTRVAGSLRSNATLKPKLWLLRFSSGRQVYVWLFVQHGLLACSSVAFLRAVDAALGLAQCKTSDPFWHICKPFLIFYATTVLPQVPRARYSRALQQLQVAVAKHQQTLFSQLSYGRVLVWADPSLAREADAIYATQLPEASRLYVAQTSETSSRIISLVLHALTLSYLTSSGMLVAFAASAALTILSIRSSRQSEHQGARSEQRAAGTLAAARHRFSDAVLRGEGPDYARWQTDLSAATNTWADCSNRNETLLSNHARNTSLLCALPILLAFLYQMHSLTRTQASMQELSVVMVALLSLVPRFLFNLEHCITLINQWPRAVSARLRLAQAEASLLEMKATPGTISHDKLLLRQLGDGPRPGFLSSLDVLQSIKVTLLQGRYLLTGPNGAGKTTYLLNIKQHHADRCVYVSAVDRDAQSAPGSTGERLMARIMTLVEELNTRPNSPIGIVLLDEWDAHLDAARCALVDAHIDDMSRRVTVIEVRHKKP